MYVDPRKEGHVSSKPTVGVTSKGRPIDWYVDKQVALGRWREQLIPAEVVGLGRPLTVLRAPRKSDLITREWYGSRDTFCPPIWWDLAIGSGACGLGCRACWLLGIIFSVVGAVAAATKTNLGLGTVPWLLLAIAAFVASLPACIAWAVGMHLHAIGAKGEKEE